MGEVRSLEAKRAERRRARSTPERILEAAIDVFAEQGYEGSSVREIARRAGANAALVNYHWGSKERLWVAACERVAGRLRRVGERAVDFSLPLPDLVRRFLGELFDALVDDPRPARIGLWSSLQAGSMDLPTLFPSIGSFFRLGAGFLNEERRAGRITNPDPEMALMTFYGQFLEPFIDRPGHQSFFGTDVSGDRAHAERTKQALIRSAFAILGIREAFGDGEAG